jgi:hypothetical protein
MYSLNFNMEQSNVGTTKMSVAFEDNYEWKDSMRSGGVDCCMYCCEDRE